MWIRIKQHGYQNTEDKAEPVWYSALYAYSATYLIACHCLSSLVLNILKVVVATVPPESEFQSWTILWLNTFLQTSSLLWRASNLFLFLMQSWYIVLQLWEGISPDQDNLTHSWFWTPGYCQWTKVFFLFTCFGRPLKVINHLGHENQTGSLA